MPLALFLVAQCVHERIVLGSLVAGRIGAQQRSYPKVLGMQNCEVNASLGLNLKVSVKWG